ncbi:MAG TPA: putative Ig domain-containing protein [Chthoniobacterales bacterium]|nr:putative Ig domain-containing protein [Chthoniobacterales bacterium]
MKKIALVLLGGVGLWSAASTLQAQSNYEPYSFITRAGLASPGSANGTGSAARFHFPNGVAADSVGNVYVADGENNTIRKITPSGVVSTFAGLAGIFGSADGAGSVARFSNPHDVAIDGAGNIYVADTSNSTIRKITPSGVVTTLAGLADSVGSVDGTGSAARFFRPEGVAVDSAGNVYVADSLNSTIRRITPSGVVSTIAGLAGSAGSDDGVGSAARFLSPHGIAVDSAGDIFVADTDNFTIRKITPSRVVTTYAGLAGNNGVLDGVSDGTGSGARFRRPEGVAVDGAGHVYVGDSHNNTVRKITPSRVVSTLAGLQGSQGSENGVGSTARFYQPFGVALDAAGNVYVGDLFNNAIRKITPSAVVTTVAGLPPGRMDGTGSAARFSSPWGMAADQAGNVYVGDRDNYTIRKISPAGVVSTFAGLSGSSGASDGTGSAARFFLVDGLAADGAGNVYVADSYTIRKITPSGLVTTLAGQFGSQGNADGTGSAARFSGPSSVAVDDAGYVYVADKGNNTIRKITPQGDVTTLAGLAGSPGSVDGAGSAARFNYPEGITADAGGNLYVADASSNTIRKITPSGVVTTLAGLAGSFGSADGTGSAARFSQPRALAVDGRSNIYVADSNYLIRKVTRSGVVTTIGGQVDAPGSADGRGSAARFNLPYGIASDRAGNVYVADTYNHTVRRGVAIPAITSPLTASATVDQQFIYQFETTGATSRSVSNLPPGLTYNDAISAIVGTPTAAGTFQVNLSASNSTVTTHAILTLTIQNAPSGPTIVSSTAATGRTGRRFTFQVFTIRATSAARLSATNLPPGFTLHPVTGLISGTPTADGSSTVNLTLTDGAASATGTLQLTFSSDPALPAIISSNSATLRVGQPFTYTILAPAVTDPGDTTVFTLLGDLPAGLIFDPATGTISGTFGGTAQNSASRPGGPKNSGGVITNTQLFATNSSGTTTIPFNLFAVPPGVANISTRLSVGADPSVLIGGFIITGNAPKKVVIRAIAPSLSVGGVRVPGTLPDPTLELVGNGLSATNDDWRATQEQEIIDTTVPPTSDRESAMVATLTPGNYTAIVRGKRGQTGIGLVEVYDLGTAILESSSNAKLANISTRGSVQRGDNVMIGGFIISGATTRVIVRAIGPDLTGRGVPGALQDTTLELHGAGGLIASNDDWQTSQRQQIIDTTVPPRDPRESALVANLPPGNYTAIVRGKGGSTGVALVEVYALQ